MPKVMTNVEQFIFAYKTWHSGDKRQQIKDSIEKEFGSSPAIRTLSDWIKRFSEVPEEEIEKDQPVGWLDLAKDGLRWEMGGGVLNFSQYQRGRPSKRFLKWWWRLSVSGDWKEETLFKWAKKYEELELKELFGIRTRELSNEYFTHPPYPRKYKTPPMEEVYEREMSKEYIQDKRSNNEP
tara:strand:+ start:395 stop:937 length:543 start_codon:yes stop_codon:yes gene_type:complete